MPRNKDRLRWRCRRGMRELDLILSTFLDDNYDNLSDAEQASFETLLTFGDDQLLRWLTGRVIPDDPTVSGIIATITSAGTGQ